MIETNRLTVDSAALAKRIGVERIEECYRFPKYFEIETVHACNARCTICTIHDWHKRPALMEESLFIKFVDEAVKYSDWVETICLSRDGEPTLDPLIAEKIKRLKRGGIKHVTLTTNAHLLTTKLCESLISADLDDIMISIDGLTKEVYESIRIGLNFDLVMENTRSLIRIRNREKPTTSIRVRMVITKDNRHQVDDFLAYWRPLLAAHDRVYAMPAHSWGNQLPNAVKNESIITAPCVFLFSSMAIHSDGIIGMCNVDYNSLHALGDLKQQSVREIWNSKPYMALRKIHLEGRRNTIGFCDGCNLWERIYRE